MPKLDLQQAVSRLKQVFTQPLHPKQHAQQYEAALTLLCLLKKDQQRLFRLRYVLPSSCRVLDFCRESRLRGLL
jgi:hypothetical protein